MSGVTIKDIIYLILLNLVFECLSISHMDSLTVCATEQQTAFIDMPGHVRTNNVFCVLNGCMNKVVLVSA